MEYIWKRFRGRWGKQEVDDWEEEEEMEASAGSAGSSRILGCLRSRLGPSALAGRRELSAPLLSGGAAGPWED